MKRTDAHLDTNALGRPARDATGWPTVAAVDAVAFVRHHLDIERVRSGDTDAELEAMWRDEAAAGGDGDTNMTVLERVVARTRVGD